METARQSWIRFMKDVWARRDAIMEGPEDQVDQKVNRIYAMYNYKDGKAIENWPTVLAQAKAAFETRASSTRFKFQVAGLRTKGKDIADAIDDIIYLAGQPNMDMASIAGTRPSYKARISQRKQKLSGDYKKGKLKYDQMITRLKKYQQEQLKDALSDDPQIVLGEFLWYHRRGADASGRPFRLYASPLPQHSVPVFIDMVRWLRGKAAVAGLDHTKGPQKGKVSMPKPFSARVDRIVMYCKGEEQLEQGVEWFRDYQIAKGKQGLFEAIRPRSTQQVEGLKGIGISQQPLPNEDILTDAGVPNKKLKGMSFGKSRAALLYLALRDAKFEFTFRANCRRLIEAAGFDIDQTLLPEF